MVVPALLYVLHHLLLIHVKVLHSLHQTLNHRLNMELDFQSLFGLLTSCVQLYSLAETP